jgi:hypothetical protein
LGAFFPHGFAFADIPINSVQRSDPSRYGVLIELGIKLSSVQKVSNLIKLAQGDYAQPQCAAWSWSFFV